MRRLEDSAVHGTYLKGIEAHVDCFTGFIQTGDLTNDVENGRKGNGWHINRSPISGVCPECGTAVAGKAGA